MKTKFYEGGINMYVATMYSEHYCWTSLGCSEDKAIEALRCAWNDRQIVLSKDDSTFKPTFFTNSNEMNHRYGVRVTRVRPGECVMEN